MSDGWDPIDQLLARDEIRQLPLRYAAALQQGDVEAMVGLFVPDARFGSYGEGPDALRRLTRASIEASPVIVLLVANHLIELASPDEATGEVWARCYAQTTGEGYVEQIVRYEDRYARHDGRWRFVRRRHRLLFGVAAATSPFDQAPADWPRSQVGVGDLALEDERFREWYEQRGTEGVQTVSRPGAGPGSET